MKKRLLLSTGLGALISIGAFFLAFRNVPLKELGHYFTQIQFIWIIPTVAIIILGFLCRVQRWRLILGERYYLPFFEAYHPMMIGFMVNCILPGRIGEIARPVILKKRDKIPFSTVLATVAAERLFDMLFLLLFFAITLSTVEIDNDLAIPFGSYTLNKAILTQISTGMVRLLILLIAAVLVITIPRSRDLIKRLILKLPALFFFLGKDRRAFIERRIAKPLANMTDNIAFGFSQVKNPRRLLGCLLLSAATWILYGLSYYTMTFGSPGIELTFSETFAMLIIICFIIALPSVPGFWGLWEAGGVFALTIFGITGEAAAGYTLINHAIQIVPVIVLGFHSAFKIGVNIFKLEEISQ